MNHPGGSGLSKGTAANYEGGRGCDGEGAEGGEGGGGEGADGAERGVGYAARKRKADVFWDSDSDAPLTRWL